MPRLQVPSGHLSFEHDLYRIAKRHFEEAEVATSGLYVVHADTFDEANKPPSPPPPKEPKEQ